MRRILTKGFTSLWNLMKLQAKPFVATMRRKCFVKSTTENVLHERFIASSGIWIWMKMIQHITKQ